MTLTRVAPSAIQSLSPSLPTFPSLNVSQFWTRTSKASFSFPPVSASVSIYYYSDGTISYDEMLQYFLSANSLLRERFTHRFEEHTFLGTAVCEHCKGMVRAMECWVRDFGGGCYGVSLQMKGIVKQGVRCRDCGISCHKHCKDHVVVDCNKRKARKCECMRLPIDLIRTLLLLTAKKTDSLVESEDTEVYGHGDSLLRERLQRAEEVRVFMV